MRGLLRGGRERRVGCGGGWRRSGRRRDAGGLGGIGGSSGSAGQVGDTAISLTPEQRDALIGGACAGWSNDTEPASSCAYALPEPPAGEILDPNDINVVITDASGRAEPILQNPAVDCNEGWQFVEPNTVVLCSGTCARVNADHATVDVLLACATIPGPPR